MFGFLSRSNRLKKLERRIDSLEKQNEVLTMAMKAIQDNLISAVASSRSLERDVREIRAVMNEFVRQAEQAHAAYLLSSIPDDGYEH